MRNAATSFLAALFVVVAGSAYADPLRVTLSPLENKAIASYAVMEYAVTLKSDVASYTNPFDPDEVRIDAYAKAPDGSVLHIPGFWSQDFSQETVANGAVRLMPNGDTPGWRVRIAYPMSGQWTLAVTAQDKTGVGTSAPLTISVNAPQTAGEHGFVGRAPGNNRYFAFSDGSPYFPVGENICWAQRKGLGDFATWFSDLSAAGGNYTRVWMSHEALESKTSGLGRYDLKNAAFFDGVLRLAQQNGIRCMMALGTYGEFNTGGYFNEGSWPSNPYNAKNGGPVPADKPDDFFTNVTARKLYQRRLRYLVARYSAFTSLGFWEFWNEKAGPSPWFSEMAIYLKKTDPYTHLVTNSYPTVGEAAVWELPEIDVTQTHRYGDEGSIYDFADIIPPDASDHDDYDKPHLMGEFGISWRGGDEKFDPKGTATNLHNGLWASALSGNAGGASIWWWDSYVAPKNLYSAFTGLSRFAASVDWSHSDFQPIDLPAPLVRTAVTDKTPAPPHDLILYPTAGWGEKADDPVVVVRDGQTTGGPLISTLMGPDKKAQRSVLALNVDLPRPSHLVLHVQTVSVRANIHITVDGKPVADFPLDASPSAKPEYESTKQFPEYGGIYQALFNKDRSTPIPVGKHIITIENTVGDWVSIGSYTLEKAHDPNEDSLRILALQDDDSGETLAWIQDPDSNWVNDRTDSYVPRSLKGVPVTFSLPQKGQYRVTWWDTRTGKPIKSSRITVESGDTVRVLSPAFTRDIALRADRAYALSEGR